MKIQMSGIAAVLLTTALAAKPPVPKFITTASGLQYVDLRVGKGKPPADGQVCSVLFRAWLYQDSKRGKLFDSAQNPAKPFRFAIGQGQVNAGWDEGVLTMRPGGRRILLVPPDLGYGDAGAGADIPPGATLLYEMDLLAVKNK